MDQDEATSPVRIVMTSGADGDTGSHEMVQHSEEPLSVSRPRARPDMIVIFAEDSDGDGFAMTITEAIARQLVLDLMTVLKNPEHDGFRYAPAE